MSENKEKSKGEDIYSKLNAFKPEKRKCKKHPCKDCFNCLFCSDARCTICLKNEKQDN